MAKGKFIKGEIGFHGWNIEEYGITEKLLIKLRESFFKEACESIKFEDVMVFFSKNASSLEITLPLGIAEDKKNLVFKVNLDEMIHEYLWLGMYEDDGPKKSVLSKKLRKLADKIDNDIED